MNPRQAALRLAVILAAAGVFGIVDAVARPIPKAAKKETPPVAAAAADPAHPAANPAHTVEWLKQHADAGTAQFIDARPPEQFAAGHLPGAINLPFEAFLGGDRPPALDLLDPEGLLIIYCGGGDCDASHKVSDLLATFGFAKTEIFEPGFPAWEASKLPIEKAEGN